MKRQIEATRELRGALRKSNRPSFLARGAAGVVDQEHDAMRAVLATHDSTSRSGELYARPLERVASHERVDRIAILSAFAHQSDHHVLGEPLQPDAPELARISWI